ncbi:MAG TPA: murein L,D-transpeptidase catalytic domain family protein [Chitinophagaceae bacterium]|nr:murein L,D-transpeptidase catalytic domain family protein [Chitinophagaceae bacterium]
MRKWVLTIIITIGAASFAFFYYYNKVPLTKVSTKNVKKSLLPKLNKEVTISTKILQAKKYIEKNKLSNQYCFLINMQLPSNKNRMYVVNLKNDSIVAKGLVAHGSCNTTFLKNAQFSNTPDCGCSSLGKYKVGYKYKGQFGEAFKLYGLDSSNSNAFKRYIVLHSYECVPTAEQDYPICNSLGCPMVAPLFLQTLQQYIQISNKPILLWIF